MSFNTNLNLGKQRFSVYRITVREKGLLPQGERNYCSEANAWAMRSANVSKVRQKRAFLLLGGVNKVKLNKHGIVE
jgi:hypothetical protein